MSFQMYYTLLSMRKRARMKISQRHVLIRRTNRSFGRMVMRFLISQETPIMQNISMPVKMDKHM